MAFSGKVIENKFTGQKIKFIQTGKDTDGKLLEMETSYAPHSKEPVAHYHPLQDENFEVVAGEMNIRINGSIKVLKKGDTLHIAANTVHSMWNNSENETVMNWKVTPALATDHFLETATGLSNDGQVNKDGKPGLLQISLMASKYSNVFRLTKPPFAVQKILFAILSPVAYLAGFRSTYKRYLD